MDAYAQHPQMRMIRDFLHILLDTEDLILGIQLAHLEFTC